MKRHIQRTIETLIARTIIEQAPQEGATLVVDASQGQYTVDIR